MRETAVLRCVSAGGALLSLSRRLPVSEESVSDDDRRCRLTGESSLSLYCHSFTTTATVHRLHILHLPFT